MLLHNAGEKTLRDDMLLKNSQREHQGDIKKCKSSLTSEMENTTNLLFGSSLVSPPPFFKCWLWRIIVVFEVYHYSDKELALDSLGSAIFFFRSIFSIFLVSYLRKSKVWIGRFFKMGNQLELLQIDNGFCLTHYPLTKEYVSSFRLTYWPFQKHDGCGSLEIWLITTHCFLCHDFYRNDFTFLYA